MSEEPQKVEVEVKTPPSIVDDEKRQKKLAGLAKAREAKKQKALLKKQQEMEDALKNKSEKKSKKEKEKKKESDSSSDEEGEEVDIETILTALDNTASSKKIDQIHQLLTDLREMKLKFKEKKKEKKKKASTTTSSLPPSATGSHNKIRDKAKSNINTLVGGFGKLTD